MTRATPSEKGKHSPLPWAVDKQGLFTDPDGIPIARAFDNPDSGAEEFGDETSTANAAFIVRAVNCHEELVTAAHKALEEISRTPGAWFSAPMLRAAIAKSEAGQ
jgi:hypothetical protein